MAIYPLVTLAVDVSRCGKCDGALRLISLIEERSVAEKLLKHLALSATTPPVAPPPHSIAGSVRTAGSPLCPLPLIERLGERGRTKQARGSPAPASFILGAL